MGQRWYNTVNIQSKHLQCKTDSRNLATWLHDQQRIFTASVLLTKFHLGCGAFELQKGDSIYIFSDGYQDQFGGEKDKKFGSKRLKQLLIDIQDKTMEEQKAVLTSTLSHWISKSDSEQLDDICILGIKLAWDI